jgi:hypothetical protein
MTPRVISLYLDRPGWGSGWRRMIVVADTRTGGKLLLEPCRNLRSLDLHAGSESGHNSFG